MILFVFEGENREPTLFKTLEYLYFSKNKQIRICSYKNNIYDLYKRMNETDEPEDIVSILKNKLVADKDNPLKEIRRRSDFSQIYLFFDYDSHNNKDQNISDSQIQKMLDFFNDESSDYGKLFINYPMVESIRYVKNPLPDNDYFSYTTQINLGKKFKEKANSESFYKNLDFITFRINLKTLSLKIPEEKERIEKIRQNWELLLKMNVQKANFICTDKNDFPENEEDISQDKIFKNQLEKYIAPKREVAILNSFPLFLFEYKDKLK
ncbi:hypothetical protein Tresu_0305 [Treponema succinifaciens DSM 2489]|uniref:Uncharacterized protein n=2 Tax=Treponema TaxID=157 RepID=F2NUH1_TRES6|nr:hypothetical protein Tresu_0305 [Treponema succinifaciens DSM 2489]